MHCNYTSWNFYSNTGLHKCPVILQYPSGINELQVIDSFWSYFLVLRPPSEDELLERGDGGGEGGGARRRVEGPPGTLRRRGRDMEGTRSRCVAKVAEAAG
jgi:hypothetical protein